MAEWKLFEGDVADVSTFAFHKHRERAAHLEQAAHAPRLKRAAQLVSAAAYRLKEERNDESGPVTVSDLGCGDGGLLQLLSSTMGSRIRAWGYDFAPANAAGWRERGVDGRAADIIADWGNLEFGDVVVMTEVLEHLTNPHLTVDSLIDTAAQYLVCSSPWTEHAESHDACHAWAFDMDGYRAMLEGAGWEVLVHDPVGMFQVVLAKRVTP